MIELLLEAERAVTHGRLDRADTLYWQIVERDPHNSIAVVGLARVALERDDMRTALQFARKALSVDPENVAAQRMVARLDEVLAYQDESAATGKAGVGATHTAPPTASMDGAPPKAEPADPTGGAARRSRFGRLFGRD